MQFTLNQGSQSKGWESGAEENALVQRVRAGDELALQQLVKRHQSKVFRTILGILGKPNEVEDLAQQVFTKVYFSIDRFDFRCSLFTWIYRITVNECYDYLRKKRVRKLVYAHDLSPKDGQPLDMFDTVRDAAVPVDRAVGQRDLVMKLLARLSEEERSLILLREVEGRTVEELAAMTGSNENTIKVRLFRIRQKLIKVAQCLMPDRRTGVKLTGPSRMQRRALTIGCRD
jgi:RNA polymerase sigma-70 factor (ECF subfamily)